MVSEERAEDGRGRRALLWALLASIAIHALLVPLASWSWLAKLPLVPAKPTRETIVASTAVRIERRSVPRPRTHAAARRPPMPPMASRVPRPATRAARPQPTPQKRIERPARQSVPLEAQIARQQREFSQEVARLHARDNPLSLAPPRREPPATFRRTYFDVPGHRPVDAVQIQLIPLRRWYEGATICYYTRYVAQFTAGGSEDGTIPWPVCYPAN
ncbi:MAG TPA: hypothetical protein VIJ77_02440, partial [Candidatus Tumulicola sp.]